MRTTNRLTTTPAPKAARLALAVLLALGGLLALNGCGSGDDTKSGSGPLLLRALIVSPVHGTVMQAGVEVTFQSSVTGGNYGGDSDNPTYFYTWRWDGAPNFSNEANPTVTFDNTMVGTVNVYLTVRDIDGTTDSDSIAITVVFNAVEEEEEGDVDGG